MNIKTSDVLGYLGNVEVNLIREGKTRHVATTHNSGTIDLCAYLRDALLGREISDQCPRSIIACKSGANDSLVDMFSLGYPFSERWRGKDIADDTGKSIGSTAIFKFIIPWTYMSAGDKISGFRLVNNEGRECALVKLPTEIEVAEHTNIEVKWTLIVTY